MAEGASLRLHPFEELKTGLMSESDPELPDAVASSEGAGSCRGPCGAASDADIPPDVEEELSALIPVDENWEEPVMPSDVEEEDARMPLQPEVPQ